MMSESPTDTATDGDDPTDSVETNGNEQAAEADATEPMGGQGPPEDGRMELNVSSTGEAMAAIRNIVDACMAAHYATGADIPPEELQAELEQMAEGVPYFYDDFARYNLQQGPPQGQPPQAD